MPSFTSASASAPATVKKSNSQGSLGSESAAGLDFALLTAYLDDGFENATFDDTGMPSVLPSSGASSTGSNGELKIQGYVSRKDDIITDSSKPQGNI